MPTSITLNDSSMANRESQEHWFWGATRGQCPVQCQEHGF